jgi:hypothetical protein
MTPQQKIVEHLVAALDSIADRASLIGFLAPLRLPHDLPDNQRARLTEALMRAAARCWQSRSD